MSKNNEWGVVIGKPTQHWSKDTLQDARDSLIPIIGTWVPAGLDGNQPYPALFDTRAEARQAAKKYAKHNKYWNYHAKKYSP